MSEENENKETVNEKSITIKVVDHDYLHPTVDVKGDFNGSQMRRVLAATGKQIRLRATQAHYAKQYEEEAKEEAKRLAIEKEKEEQRLLEEKRLEEEYEQENTLLDNELTDETEDKDVNLPEEDDEQNEKDDNDLSYLSDSTSESKPEE